MNTGHPGVVVSKWRERRHDYVITL
jgi:hypothetical protein